MHVFDISEYIVMLSIYRYLLFLPYFMIGKIFSRDYKIRVKESIAIVLFTLLVTAFRMIPGTYLMITGIYLDVFPFFTIGSRVVTLLFLFLYFWLVKKCFIRNAITASIFTHLTIALATTLHSIPFTQLTGVHFSFNTLYQFMPALAIIYPLTLMALYMLFAFLLNLFVGKLQKKIKTSIFLQTGLAAGSLISWLLYQVISTLQFIELQTFLIPNWMQFLLLGFVGVGLFSLFLFLQYNKAKSAVFQKEANEKAMTFYIKELERQQNSLKTFQHDYKNILFSLEDFLKHDDLGGLKKYYFTRIKKASENILKNEFALGQLSHIKVREVKSILTAKLSSAQNMNITVSLQVFDDIEHIAADSVTLVRILGILLDNAIEELVALGEGTLEVACYKQEDSVSFVVENTCREDISTLQKLKEAGFSTKGDGRGLGLSNLAALVSACPNISLQTTLKKGIFMQKIIIDSKE